MKESRGDVKDLSLAAKGVDRIKWAAREMSVIAIIRERFSRERPLKGVRIFWMSSHHQRDGQPGPGF